MATARIRIFFFFIGCTPPASPGLALLLLRRLFFTTSRNRESLEFLNPQLNFSAPQFLVLCPLCICEQLLSGARNKGIGARLTQQNFWPPARHHHHLASLWPCLWGRLAIAKPTRCRDFDGRYRLRFRLNRIDPPWLETNSTLLLANERIAADAPLTKPCSEAIGNMAEPAQVQTAPAGSPRGERCCTFGFVLFLFVGTGLQMQDWTPAMRDVS